MPAPDDPALQRYLDVLRLIVQRLAGSDVVWAVTGSLGCRLQGVPVQPHDIDISSDARGVYEIARRLAAFVTRPVVFSGTERIRSHFGALEIHGIQVEIMGDVEICGADGVWVASDQGAYRFVQVAELSVPVLSLQAECAGYLRLGRTARAQLLRAWLTAHGDEDSET